MYQMKVNKASKPRLVVVLAVIVILALSLLAIRLFVTTPLDTAPSNAVVPRDAPNVGQDAALREHWIERHMNPIFDADNNLEFSADTQAANTMRERWIEHHMNENLDQMYDLELAADIRAANAMRAQWIEHHMNPIFDR